MFQGKGFIILLVITVFAFQQFEARPSLEIPKILSKDVDVVVDKDKKGLIKGPLKVAAAVKTAAALKTAALIKGAVIVKGIKGAAIIKGATALKAGKIAKKPVKILDTVKDKIVDIVKPTISIDKPLLGLF